MIAPFSSRLCPVYITVRDRVEHLRGLVAWLESAGCERIVLVDNDSAWPPLIDYLAGTPHEVVRLGQNAGARAVWLRRLMPTDGWYVVTDPDLDPDGCPLDALERLHDVMERHPRFIKAGVGLRLDDLPESMDSLEWERSLVGPHREIEPGVFDSLVDTTFALYRPGTADHQLGPAVRLGAPYVFRHPSWYAEAGELSDEDRFYLSRATRGPMGSSWAQRAAA